MGKACYRFKPAMALSPGMAKASPTQRWRQVQWLAQLPTGAATPALCHLLADPNPWVRRRAEGYYRLLEPPATPAPPKSAALPGTPPGKLAALRKQQPPPGLIIDEGDCTVLLAGQPIVLTATEFRLLLTLAQHQGNFVTKETLYCQAVDDWAGGENNNALKNLIRKLRHKLADKGSNPQLIECLRNYGYRLKGTVAAEIRP